MRRWIFFALCAITFSAVGILLPARSNAGVNLNITIPLPGLVIGGPPAMVVIPGTYAYFAPDVEADIFFYRGYWYRPYGGQWYFSVGYSGPWGYVSIEKVPPVLLHLPPYYRQVPSGYERMPYGMVKRNWRTWENERYWDNYERRDEYARPRRGHGMGRGMGMGRGGDD